MHSLTEQFIDNAWVPSRADTCHPVHDPYRETRIGEVTRGDTADVEVAVAAARRALPDWRDTAEVRRGEHLDAIAAGLEARREGLAELSSRNNGKPLAEAHQDLDDAIACYRYYATQARALGERQGQADASGIEGLSARRYWDAIGVVALITPWNFPLVSSAWKLAPALAAGCTVVFKPSEVTPLPERVLAEVVMEAGLPPGVFNLLHGDGEGIGAPLSHHPGIDKLSFTGSNPVGERVMHAATHGVRPVSLELGGKSPILVTEDADLGLARDLVMAGICYNAGQMCSATSRLLVHERLADELYAAIDAAMGALRLGDPLAPETEMGPLVSATQRDRVQEYLALADQEGLHSDTPHRALPESGCFVAPRLYRDVPTTSRLWREEIFGPVLCARRVASDEEAIALANDSDFGLAATVVAGDPDRAEAIARRLDAGNVWCNCDQVAPPHASWGGMKRSGIGRELGPAGLDAYLEPKRVTRTAGA
ncbi:aldehyde dehydrogenase family protein [Halomonas urumqiensis]|uniref:Aldehyde dehydrogenase n=1 Tax=Halomonas urumqiensis TaxID=1684789 RepID=A0A2N7UNK4_9GAMM|nr:aldehyde dehydrogenase family protein [Halomonas urumqiensis]PMR82024.1 aldehyde dehydrogenase [Halomonas urumqiensis]PTB02644.1 aldehyde dehydrogenase [Halomonas urumqiensis]GHE21129.1 betaine-aldehyde dehydrogenase [Halomonas urumqiensis]